MAVPRVSCLVIPDLGSSTLCCIASGMTDACEESAT